MHRTAPVHALGWTRRRDWDLAGRIVDTPPCLPEGDGMGLLRLMSASHPPRLLPKRLPLPPRADTRHTKLSSSPLLPLLDRAISPLLPLIAQTKAAAMSTTSDPRLSSTIAPFLPSRPPATSTETEAPSTPSFLPATLSFGSLTPISAARPLPSPIPTPSSPHPTGSGRARRRSNLADYRASFLLLHPAQRPTYAIRCRPSRPLIAAPARVRHTAK